MSEPSHKEPAARSVPGHGLRALFVASAASRLLLAADFAVQAWRHIEAEERAGRAVDARGALRELLGDLREAEGATRGFVITGDPLFLKPLDDLAATSPSRIAALRSLALAEPDQSRLLEELERLVERRFQISEELVEAYRRTGPEAAAALVATREGLQATAAIQRAITAMIDHEQRSLEAGRLAAGQARSRGLLAAVAFAAGASGLLAAGYQGLRRAAREREETRSRLHAILDTTPMVVFMKDVEGRYLLANRRFEDLFHVRQEELVGRTDRDVFPPESAEAFVANDRKVFEANAPLQMEEVVPHDDGPHTYMSFKSPIRDRAGRPVAICGIAVDITERKRLEQERDRFFSQSMDLQCIAGFDGAFKRLNPAWERTLGLSLDELHSSPFIELIHPEDRDRTVEAFARNLSGKSTVDFENRYRCADGTYRWLRWSASPDRDAGLIYATARDVTQQKATLEETQRARAAAEEANRELEAFGYSVSHDLRAPLRSIDGFSKALLEDCGKVLDERGISHLERIRAAARRMGELIDDLLMLSRITRAEVRRGRIDLSRLAGEVSRAHERQNDGRRASVEIESGLMAPGDPHLLRVLFDNLLGNAFKFTRQRPVAHVEVGSYSSDGEKVFFVRDNGAGFDMKYAAKLFAPFQRLHSSREFEGTGIGLATVARIVHKHGGRVWADSKVDGGATIYFTLGTTSEEASNEGPAHPPGGGQPGRRGAHAQVLQG